MTIGRPSQQARRQVFKELLELINRGLTPAQALDYWVTVESDHTYGGLNQSQWSEHRGRTNQTISERVKFARETLDWPSTDPVDRPDQDGAEADDQTPDVEVEFWHGFETVIEQDDRSEDRVVDHPFCTSCGCYYEGDGLCEKCSNQLDDDLIADREWSG